MVSFQPGVSKLPAPNLQATTYFAQLYTNIDGFIFLFLHIGPGQEMGMMARLQDYYQPGCVALLFACLAAAGFCSLLGIEEDSLQIGAVFMLLHFEELYSTDMQYFGDSKMGSS